MSSASGGAPWLWPDPAGGLLSPVPLFCPPPKQISGLSVDTTVRDITKFSVHHSMVETERADEFGHGYGLWGAQVVRIRLLVF